jgi:hypothetical protein
MKTGISILAVLLLVVSYALAQPHPNILWTHTYGGTSDDKCWWVQQTKDGGYILTGWTWSFGAGESDIYLVRTDNLGHPLWTRTVGGNFRDESYFVQETADQGFVVAGFTRSFGSGSGDAYIIKTNSSGHLQWTRTFGGNDEDGARCVRQTTDGGYIAAGEVASWGAGDWDVYLVKMDAQGNLQWQRAFGGRYHDYAIAVQQTTDGGYVVAGITNSFGAGGADFYVIKTNNQGIPQWSRTYGGSSDEMANAVQQTNDGGFMIAGWTYSFGAGDADVYLVKTNSQGVVQWTRTYGGTGFDGAGSARQMGDGRYILAGYMSTDVGDSNFMLMKVDSNGNLLWKRNYGGRNDEIWGCVCPTYDGGFVVGGWTFSYGLGYDDYFLVKTGPDHLSELECESVGIGIPNQYTLYPNYPNPFNSTTQITYSIPTMSQVSLIVFNPLGQEVTTLTEGMQSAGIHAVSFDGLRLASGAYFYRLQAGEFVQTGKMVLMK